MISMLKGTHFYYADRDKREPVICIVQAVNLEYPNTIFAKRTDTDKIIRCYDGFGCYHLDEYDEAYADAQIQEKRII